MAVYFQTECSIDRYIVHRADPRDIKVHVVHNPSDGYLPAKSGEIIKESMPLKDFIIRLIRLERNHPNSDQYFDERVEENIQKTLIALSQGDISSKQVSEWLDRRYSDLIRHGKIKLAEHEIDTRLHHNYVAGADPYTERETISNKQHAIYQVQHGDITPSEHMKKEHPMTIDEGFRTSDKEVYYLLN